MVTGLAKSEHGRIVSRHVHFISNGFFYVRVQRKMRSVLNVRLNASRARFNIIVTPHFAHIQ